MANVLPVLIEIGKKRAAVEGELCAALERGDDALALRLARDLCGLSAKGK